MDTAMEFELTLRLLFGEEAYQTAGSASHPGHRRSWLKKAVKKLQRVVNDLDTTPRHQRMLMTDLEAVSQMMKNATDPSWELVYRLFRLSMRLLGYDRGARCHSPVYNQTAAQHYTAIILKGGDTMGEVLNVLEKGLGCNLA